MTPEVGAALALNRLDRGSSTEDRRDFAECFNTTLDVLGVKPGEEFYITHPSFTEARVPEVGKCVLCGEPVNWRVDLRRVRGWEKKAPGGQRKGGSDVLARETIETEWAHERCVKAEKSGVSARQESLIA